MRRPKIDFRFLFYTPQKKFTEKCIFFLDVTFIQNKHKKYENNWIL